MHRMGIQHSHYIQDRGILRGSYRSILRMEGLREQLGLLVQLGELEGWDNWGTGFSSFEQFFEFGLCSSDIFSIIKVYR